MTIRIPSTPIVEKVALLLQSASLDTSTIKQIARECCMSDTTLARRLEENGASFKRLREAERRRRVELELSVNPNTTCRCLAEIAQYSCSQTLTRAFAKWFGMTLRQYKDLLEVSHEAAA